MYYLELPLGNEDCIIRYKMILLAEREFTDVLGYKMALFSRVKLSYFCLFYFYFILILRDAGY